MNAGELIPNPQEHITHSLFVAAVNSLLHGAKRKLQLRGYAEKAAATEFPPSYRGATRWGRLRAIRSVLSVVAFLLFVYLSVFGKPR
jgi:hypothetical protein